MAVVYFQQDGFHPSANRIVGRPVAGLGLIKAVAAASAPGPLRLVGAHAVQLDAFLALESAEAVLRPGQSVDWIDDPAHPALREDGTLYLHGPGLLAELAWKRRSRDPTAYSLCAVHHTFSTHDMMEVLGQIVVAPVMPWDALVCTSRAAKSAIEAILMAQEAYLGERFGKIVAPPRPAMPVIPLGVRCDDFDPGRGEQGRMRSDWRNRLGIAADDAVMLSFGRQTFLGKAHPVPLFAALARLAGTAPGPLHLIMAGWFPSDTMQQQFREAATLICPAVTVHWLDGNDPAVRREIWHAADLFVSPSDTIQETFGLTPVEAMAAGLPAVVSDWNGYRDTVEDGITGFRIPTLAPAPGYGGTLARWYDDGLIGPDGYEGIAALATAVDVTVLADRLHRLVVDGELRRTMGEAARRHARAVFDWAAVHRRLEALWADLTEIRRNAVPTAPALPALRDDPFRTFAAYPTDHLDADSVLAAGDASPAYVAILMRLEMTTFGGDAIGMNDLALAMRAELARGPRRLGNILPAEPGVDRDRALWTAGMLLKLGIARHVGRATC